MRRGFLILVVAGVMVASCVPDSADVVGSVPYLDAPVPVTTTTSVVATVQDAVVTEAYEPLVPCTPPTFDDDDGSEWMAALHDVEALPDGGLVVASGAGIARLDPSSGWEVLDLTGLPEGTHEVEWWARTIMSVAAGVDGALWAAGRSFSSVDDDSFGGEVDGYMCARGLGWVARRDCIGGECSWTVFTANEHQELVGGDVGDLAVGPDGTLFASVGGDRLVVYDGSTWKSFRVPGVLGNSWPWSGSLAVGTDGTLFAGVFGDYSAFHGVLSFDGEKFVGLRDRTREWPPGDMVSQVAVGSDGSLWAATDRIYNPEIARPDDTTGVMRFDGTSWTVYTIDDGLLSNDASIAAGPDGTVWAIHGEFPPTGYSRFDGDTWTAFPSDQVSGGFRAAVTPEGTLWWVTDDGGLMSFDGVTETSHPSPFERFRFGVDDLCDWVSAEDVAEFMQEQFDWTGSVELSHLPSDYEGCRWVLAGDTEDGWLDVGDASNWRSFAGGYYEFDGLDVTSYDGQPVDIGSVVVGHPALFPGVVVHNGGFGMFAFGIPPGPYLSVSMQVPDIDAREKTGSKFFAVANRFLDALGWLPGT